LANSGSKKVVVLFLAIVASAWVEIGAAMLRCTIWRLYTRPSQLRQGKLLHRNMKLII